LVSLPAVTVVIPTYNRRSRLGLVLAGLARQTVDSGSFEVVVIDDGSTDGTGQWVEGQDTPYALRLVSQSNRGPAAARNAGVSNARTPLVIFLDDDVVPCVDLVGEHLRMHQAEKDIVVVGPLSSLSSYRQPWVAWEQSKLEAQYQAMIRGDYAPTFRQFWTGNASVGRDHVLAVGGFDPSILRGEDVELGYRLRSRGLGFRFNPRAVGMHHCERSLDAWSNAQRSYGKLEVQIFGRFGEDGLLTLLGGNWSRLHPLNRWLVKRCVRKPVPFAAATTALRSWLVLTERVSAPVLADKVCSALANLLYWDASAEALGDRGIQAVFERGAEPAAD
jgi:glycosyltransferase involved in cell wall biosynthesis